MSYEVSGSRVLWSGKPVKGAAAGTFRVLAPIVACDGATVFVRGKAFAADAASFRVLNDGYATDGGTVWRIMETKLKPLQVEAASFEVIGPDHGRDAATVVYKDKRVALSKGRGPGDVRVIAGSLATDGVILLHGSKKEADTKGVGVDWLGAESRLLTEDGDVNAPVAVLRDGSGVWLFDKWSCEPLCQRLEDAEFETLRLVPGDVYRAGIGMSPTGRGSGIAACSLTAHRGRMRLRSCRM